MEGELVEVFLAKKIEAMRAKASRIPRLVSPFPAADINEFFELLDRVIKLQLEQDGDTSSVQLVEEMPEIDDNITGELITFSVIRRMPGTVEAVPHGLVSGDKRIRERSRVERETFDDPDNPGMVITTYGQEYDNWIQLTVWARTNKIANSRAIWLEDLMTEWAWYFQASGIKRVVFEERGPDIRISPENRKVVGRPYRFYVRTEKITVSREATLRSLVINSSLIK